MAGPSCHDGLVMTEVSSLSQLAQIGPALTVAVAAFFASMASAITGAGGAIILSFALAPIIGVASLVQTISVAMTVSHLARIQAFRREIDWRVSGIVLGGSIPGVILGAMIYTQLSEQAIALLLGVFMLVIVVLKRRLPNRQLNLPMPVILLFSFGFGWFPVPRSAVAFWCCPFSPRRASRGLPSWRPMP